LGYPDWGGEVALDLGGDERSGSGLPLRPAASDLMKSLGA
jgi:hypothetical protein